MHRRRGIGALTALVLLASAAGAQTLQSPRLPGHAHNDYLHERPLLDALAAGYCSIEVDVFAAGRRLMVAHTRAEIAPDRTLDRLYLAPLSELLSRGAVDCPGGLLLLVDFKSDAGPTLAALRTAIASHDLAAVHIVVSGNRPRQQLERDDKRALTLDGRIPDLQTSPPNDLVPLISADWTGHFDWRGTGTFPTYERKRLQEIVALAHAQGRLLRFWAVPHREALWDELLKAGVDLISVDDLQGFADFCARRAAK